MTFRCYGLSLAKMASRNLLQISQKIKLAKHIKASASLTSKPYSTCDNWVPVEKKTHTDQAWDKDDYRLARFIDKPKQINPRFAIDLINQVPPKPCKERVVWCDGGGGPTGHPKVFINLDKPGNHICGYCGLRFYKEDHHH